MLENEEDYEIVRAEYTASAVNTSQYPEEKRPHVAFIGRSNVGKSSLLNSLCNRKKLARVSGSPGKTQTINFYTAALRRLSVKEERIPFYLVDLPGYGYAKVAKSARQGWGVFIEEYLLKTEELKVVCLLMDIRHSLQPIDAEMYSWFVSNKVPFVIVATKADKVSKNELQSNCAKLARTLGIERKNIFAYSALKNSGKEELLRKIAEEIGDFSYL